MKRGLLLIFLLIFVSSCKQSTIDHHYFFSFTNESENWKVKNYEMVLTDETLKLGNGQIEMKDVDEYDTNFFGFSTYIVREGEEKRVHASSVSGRAELTEQEIGTIEGSNDANLQIDEIQHIYMNVTWYDKENKEDVTERINLYEKEIDRSSFLQQE